MGTYVNTDVLAGTKIAQRADTGKATAQQRRVDYTHIYK